MFKTVLLAVVVAASFGFAACSQEEDAAKDPEATKTPVTTAAAWNKICPVCGGEVSTDIATVTHQGKVYGFGCAGCPEKFAADPQTYVTKLSDDGTKLVEGG